MSFEITSLVHLNPLHSNNYTFPPAPGHGLYTLILHNEAVIIINEYPNFTAVFRIRIILMRIRIRGSASVMMDPDPEVTFDSVNRIFPIKCYARL